jgi:hypothetical protein
VGHLIDNENDYSGKWDEGMIWKLRRASYWSNTYIKYHTPISGKIFTFPSCQKNVRETVSDKPLPLIISGRGLSLTVSSNIYCSGYP